MSLLGKGAWYLGKVAVLWGINRFQSYKGSFGKKHDKGQGGSK